MSLDINYLDYSSAKKFVKIQRERMNVNRFLHGKHVDGETVLINGKRSRVSMFSRKCIGVTEYEGMLYKCIDVRRNSVTVIEGKGKASPNDFLCFDGNGKAHFINGVFLRYPSYMLPEWDRFNVCQ